MKVGAAPKSKLMKIMSGKVLHPNINLLWFSVDCIACWEKLFLESKFQEPSHEFLKIFFPKIFMWKSFESPPLSVQVTLTGIILPFDFTQRFYFIKEDILNHCLALCHFSQHSHRSYSVHSPKTFFAARSTISHLQAFFSETLFAKAVNLLPRRPYFSPVT